MPMYKRKRDQKAKTPRRYSKKARQSSIVKKTYDHINYFKTGTNAANHVVFRGIGFPDRLTTNLVYSESLVLDPSVGTPCPFQTFRLNSAFDPFEPLGGTQPTYFDQLAAVYSRYIVNGSKITVSFSRSTTTAANVGPYLCGIQCSDLNTLPTTDAGILVSAPNTTARFVSDQDGTVMITSTFSRKQTYPDLDDASQARTNANPSVNWIAKVFAAPQGVDVDVPINVLVMIEYNITFSDIVQVIDA